MTKGTMADLEGPEGQRLDRKSLRKVTGSGAGLDELAHHCVAFANGAGGHILVGIEDDDTHPPSDQVVEPGLVDRIRKRMGELTVNVQVTPEVRRDENGGEFIVLDIRRSNGVASTSDGRYFLRVGDSCRPLVGDEVMRLADERPGHPWEEMTSLDIPPTAAEPEKIARWSAAVRASDRVKRFVKEKSQGELLEHYALSRHGRLTNLGVLLLGTARDRSQLGSAPVVQAIKYDDRGNKVAKHVWDDHALSPLELVDAIWNEIPDFRESYELPDGMFRTKIPAFEEAVIRELLVNAMVHRPYTHRGDIFLNLHPDRLEVVNPGRLPVGVTPRNILNASRRRNDGLTRVFHDLKMMEREGSGFDLMYDRLLASGRGTPTVREGTDSVHVTVPRRVVQPGVIRLLAEADQEHQLTQRERIALGLLAQTEGLSAADLTERLDLEDTLALHPWIDRLLNLALVVQTGRTSGTRYHVPPALLRATGLDGQTTLARMQPHRLRALVVEDLERYPASSFSDIHRRVGSEIPVRTLRRALEVLAFEHRVVASGEKRWRRYRLPDPNGHPKDGGR